MGLSSFAGNSEGPDLDSAFVLISSVGVSTVGYVRS